jgi:hypothetical protein
MHRFLFGTLARDLHKLRTKAHEQPIEEKPLHDQPTPSAQLPLESLLWVCVCVCEWVCWVWLWSIAANLCPRPLPAASGPAGHRTGGIRGIDGAAPVPATAPLRLTRPPDPLLSGGPHCRRNTLRRPQRHCRGCGGGPLAGGCWAAGALTTRFAFFFFFFLRGESDMKTRTFFGGEITIVMVRPQRREVLRLEFDPF